MSIAAVSDPNAIPDGFTWENADDFCPDELRPFYKAILNKKSPAFKDLVQSVYNLWKANNFMPVELTPQPGDPFPPCSRPENSGAFDYDIPDVEDYEGGEDDIQYEWDLFRVDRDCAAAKKVCSECPFALQCLTASVTSPVIEYRRGDWDNIHVNDDYYTYNRYGIHGGYGPDARKAIYQGMTRLYQEDN